MIFLKVIQMNIFKVLEEYVQISKLSFQNEMGIFCRNIVLISGLHDVNNETNFSFIEDDNFVKDFVESKR